MSQWQHNVHALLADGYGAEDIALMLTRRGGRVTTSAEVRHEILILRQEGRLAEILRPKIKRTTTE